MRHICSCRYRSRRDHLHLRRYRRRAAEFSRLTGTSGVYSFRRFCDGARCLSPWCSMHDDFVFTPALAICGSWTATCDRLALCGKHAVEAREEVALGLRYGHEVKSSMCDHIAVHTSSVSTQIKPDRQHVGSCCPIGALTYSNLLGTIPRLHCGVATTRRAYRQVTCSMNQSSPSRP